MSVPISDRLFLNHLQMLGLSLKLRALVVCHCFRTDDMSIRIISARKADKREAAAYGR